ncbi:MAG: sensor histidine kinase [Pelagimonas sp.]|uniref:sensor histidine kinase n=1 Tax=Pelagimonas sp. TaxID=2073170 RepID=UPI003D6B1D4A
MTDTMQNTPPIGEGKGNHLRKRVFFALAVLLVPLVLATVGSVVFHRSAALNARYTVILSQLLESMALIDGQIALIEAEHEHAHHISTTSFEDALGFYGALRAADPDGDEIMSEGVSSVRAALSERTAQAGIDPIGLSAELGLLGTEMPEELAALWEEDEAWTSALGNAPSLEAAFGDILLHAATVLVDGARDHEAVEQYWAAKSKLSDEQLSGVTAVLRRNSIQAGQAPIILALTVLGAVLIAAVCAWVFVIKPLINEVVHIQGALKREAAAARAADMAKTQFLATISHELRTPMNGIIGAAQLLEHAELEEEDYELVEILRSCADGQIALIDEILTFGEVEAGAVRLVNEPVDVVKLIRDSTSFATFTADNKGLDLEVSVDPDSPIVMGDAKRLRQVIVNLVGNAIKFTETGKVSVAATIEPAEMSGDVTFRVVVSDTGPGIAREHRIRIFERFTQGDSTSSRKAGGTGLGLAIAQGIAREAKGDITVESELGEGATFTLVIPTQIANADHNKNDDERNAA